MLPDELVHQLRLILDIAPALERVSDGIEQPEEHTQPRTIPYALLTAIAKWARSPAAHDAFARHEPPLRAQDYTMLALLAGTRTSPERVFPRPDPSHSSPDDPQAASRRERSDRRAVTALLNALLSIGGAGVATWWAAERLHWRNEWVRAVFFFIPVSRARN